MSTAPLKRKQLGDLAPQDKTIIFVRHGESEYNKAMRETGKDPMIRDAPLTIRGQEQAEAARSVLASLRASASPGNSNNNNNNGNNNNSTNNDNNNSSWLLLSSPLRRALHTASRVWPEAFSGGDNAASRFEIWADLRELVTGFDDMGSRPAQLLEQFPHLAVQLE
ncbi:unnamed protein product, partial [Polarella glacialis]